MATKAKTVAAKPVTRTAGLKPAIKAAASKAAHEAAAIEFQAQKPKRVRAPAKPKAVALPYTGKRGESKAMVPQDEFGNPLRAIAHVQANGAGLTDGDIKRLVTAFQTAALPASEDKVKAVEQTKPSNPILAGLNELNVGVTELRTALQDLEVAIDPVLTGQILSEGEAAGDDNGDTESRVQREIRELRQRIYYTTCWIKGLTKRVEL